jgi:protein involved in polysaccharide export with SLBB domain
MTTVDLEPAELITLVFPGERAHPGVAEVLAELTRGRDITVLDLVFVTRTSGNQVRVTGACENPGDIGLGPLHVSVPELIGEGDLAAIRDWLRPGTSAAVIAYEHSWARRLAQAVRDAGGVVMLGRSRGNVAEGRQVVMESESEAAVQQAEAAAQRAAERYSALGSDPIVNDDLVSRLADLARLRQSGVLSAMEFEVAKDRLLAF